MVHVLLPVKYVLPDSRVEVVRLLRTTSFCRQRNVGLSRGSKGGQGQ